MEACELFSGPGQEKRCAMNMLPTNLYAICSVMRYTNIL